MPKSISMSGRVAHGMKNHSFMGAAPVCTCIVISETCTVAAATAQIFMNMMRTEVFDDSETFSCTESCPGFYENIAQSQMAVVVQTTWNDLAICQNRQLMPQAMAGAVETVIGACSSGHSKSWSKFT